MKKASDLLLESATPFDAMHALVVEISSEELRGKFNSLFAATAELFDPACMLVREMELEIEQLRETLNTHDISAANLFMQELLDSVETLSGITEKHGVRTLADLMYLQNAIMNHSFIDHYPRESAVFDIASALPSGDRWAKFIKVEQEKVRPQFEVRFETGGFTKNKSILDASFTEIEALSFSETCAKEGTFPLGVLGVAGGYITADDGQGENDIHVFTSVTLLIEAESAQQIEKMKVPEGVLTRVADLMGSDSFGNCVLDLESHSWEVMEVEEMQSKDRLAALAEANQIAGEKDVFECISTAPVDRDCSGKVMCANDYYTVISLGRNALVCPNEVLSSVPAKGADVAISFKGGVGEVVTKGKDQARNVER